MSAKFEPIIGRYMHLDLFGRPHRIYVEEAGEGTPLLCLHTAGADGRQYRALMNDARVTRNHRVIAFDMPWHGKSSPPAGWHDEEYQLTSAQYTTMILEIMTALELDRPILIGCSIGGRIALHLALEHPEALPRHHRPAGRRACRSLLRSEFPAPARRAWRRGLRRHRLRAWSAPTRRTKSAGKRCGTTCRAAPACSKAISISTRSTATSAAASRRSTPGAARCSCCPANTTIPARRRKRWRWPTAFAGCEVTIMKGLGHFPMSENPDAFLKHLLPVLEKIGGALISTAVSASAGKRSRGAPSVRPICRAAAARGDPASEARTLAMVALP